MWAQPELMVLRHCEPEHVWKVAGVLKGRSVPENKVVILKLGVQLDGDRVARTVTEAMRKPFVRRQSGVPRGFARRHHAAELRRDGIIL